MRRILSVVAVAVTLAGCASEHLSGSYGKSNATSFSQQVVPSKSGPVAPVSGLDSQEAAIIAKGYRRSLAPKTGQAQGTDQSVLLVNQNPQPMDGGSYVPPPSVPVQR
jgi:hypothetical protein